MTLTTPFQGRFVSGRLGYAKINIPTKLEVPNFTRYGNIKCAAKCKNGVVWG